MAGKTEDVIDQKERRGVDLSGISETKWKKRQEKTGI